MADVLVVGLQGRRAAGGVAGNSNLVMAFRSYNHLYATDQLTPEAIFHYEKECLMRRGFNYSTGHCSSPLILQPGLLHERNHKEAPKAKGLVASKADNPMDATDAFSKVAV